MSAGSQRVLVLDTNGQAGLSIVRSLGGRDVPVTAGSHRRLSLGRLSRYSDDAYTYPDPAESAERFVDHLLDHLEGSDYFAVIPVRDHTSALLSARKDEIEATGTTAAVEEWETFDRAYDKGRLFDIAEQLPIPTPETATPTSLAEVEEIAPDVTYPSVVKPRSKTTWDSSGQCHLTEVDDAHYVDSPEDLVATYRQVLEANPFLEAEERYPIVQEYIDGTTTTTVVLAEDGDILGHFQEKRLRTYPDSGGNSTLLQAMWEPRMADHAREVIDALEWTGPAMVEFMETPDGEFYLIEVNGRYWGSVPFAIESDADIPWWHYRQLRGEDVDPPDDYRTDVVQHRLLNGDLKWLAEQLQDGNPAATLPFLRTCLAARQTFLSREDPMPTVAAPCQTVGLVARILANR